MSLCLLGNDAANTAQPLILQFCIHFNVFKEKQTLITDALYSLTQLFLQNAIEAVNLERGKKKTLLIYVQSNSIFLTHCQGLRV